MSINKKLTLKGLVTYRDQYSEIPDGALSEANNIVLDKPGIAMPRPGFSVSEIIEQSMGGDYVHGGVTNAINYNDKLVWVTDKNQARVSTETLPADSISSVVISVGADTAVTGSQYMEFAKAKKNLYGTNPDKGVWVWDGSGEIEAAGVPKAAKPYIARGTEIPETPATGYFVKDKKIAYRILFGYYDDNNNLILGAPSERVVYTLPSTNVGQVNPALLSIYMPTRLPSDLTGWFVQVYRTKSAALTVGQDPGDYTFLAFETPLTGSTITYTDLSIDPLLVTPLYTNQNLEGSGQANYEPPRAKSLEYYNNHLVAGNCTTLTSTSLTFVSVPTEGSTVTVTVGTNSPNFNNILIPGDSPPQYSVSFKAMATPNGVESFKRYSTGDLPLDIANTARAFCDAFNLIMYAGVEAHYLPDDNSAVPPGAVQIYGLYNDIGFTIQTSAGITTVPSLTVKDTFAPESFPNRLYFSKFQESEAFPQDNYYIVGDADDQILTTKVVKDTLYIIKQKSIWKIIGETLESLTLVMVSNTINTLSAATVKVLGEYVYGLSDQGIYRLSGQVEIISDVVKDIVDDTDLTLAFSWVDSTNLIYFLNRGYLKPILAYDTAHQCFYTWDLPRQINCGFATNGRMYLGTGHANSAAAYNTVLVGGFLVQRGVWENPLAYGDQIIGNSIEISSIMPASATFVSLNTYSYVVTSRTSLYRAGVFVGEKLFNLNTSWNPSTFPTDVDDLLQVTQIIDEFTLKIQTQLAPSSIPNLYWRSFSGDSNTGPKTNTPSLSVVDATLNMYVFTVASANATVGAVYTNNSNSYTVLKTISSGTSLLCSGTAGPAVSGTLSKSSGTGDNSIVFTSFTRPTDFLYIPTIADKGVQPGDVLVHFNETGRFRIKEVVSTPAAGVLVEVLERPTGTNTTYYLYRGVTSTIEFWPFIGEGIEVYKDFKEIATINPVHPYGPMKLTYSTDLTYAQTFEEYQYSSSPIGWGNFGWGVAPWGEEGDLSEEVERSIIPIVLGKGHKLKYKWEVTTSYQRWEFSGVSLQYRNINFTPSRGGQ